MAQVGGRAVIDLRDREGKGPPKCDVHRRDPHAISGSRRLRPFDASGPDFTRQPLTAWQQRSRLNHTERPYVRFAEPRFGARRRAARNRRNFGEGRGDVLPQRRLERKYRRPRRRAPRLRARSHPRTLSPSRAFASRHRAARRPRRASPPPIEAQTSRSSRAPRRHKLRLHLRRRHPGAVADRRRGGRIAARRRGDRASGDDVDIHRFAFPFGDVALPRNATCASPDRCRCRRHG
jgi:hypothetical protein